MPLQLTRLENGLALLRVIVDAKNDTLVLIRGKVCHKICVNPCNTFSCTIVYHKGYHLRSCTVACVHIVFILVSDLMTKEGVVLIYRMHLVSNFVFAMNMLVGMSSSMISCS